RCAKASRTTPRWPSRSRTPTPWVSTSRGRSGRKRPRIRSPAKNSAMQQRRRAQARSLDVLRQILRLAGFLPASTLCLGLLGCASMTSDAGAGVPAMERVEVTPAQWLPAANIAWPDPADPAVYVYYTPDAAIRELELPASAEAVLHAGKNSIFMGQQGNKLAVLLQRPGFVSDREVRTFIAL